MVHQGFLNAMPRGAALADWPVRQQRRRGFRPQTTACVFYRLRRIALPLRSRLQLFYLLHLCRPTTDRVLFRAIHRAKVQRILELGLTSTKRTLRMVAVSQLANPSKVPHYIGIDLFEDRPDPSRLVWPLRDAYRNLRAAGARVRLIPAEPLVGLMQVANELGKLDLLVISAAAAPGEHSRAWLFLPRLLHQDTQVFCENLDGRQPAGFQRLDMATINRLATAVLKRRAA